MGITVSVKLNLDRVTAEIETRCAALAAKAAQDIEAHAKALAPVDTGLLRNSITALPVDRFHWLITSPVSYAASQEYGSDPHWITSQKASTGRFERVDLESVVRDGSTSRAFSFLHPGNPPHPYMTPAVEAIRPIIEAEARRIAA